jgi:Antibiotic biosynthesis monooxygenase
LAISLARIDQLASTTRVDEGSSSEDPHFPGLGQKTYLSCTIGKWKVDLDSEEAQDAFRLISDEGLRAFRSQPGFISYRLMIADPTTTIAVAEWENEELGKPGAQRHREWLTSSIAHKLSLETYDGEVVVAC